MMFMRSFAVVTALLFLSACQSTAPEFTQPTKILLADDVFPAYVHFAVESEQQIFELSDDAKAFVDGIVKRKHGQKAQIDALVHKIFDRTDFNMLYLNNANTIATETFQNRAANCLSLTIMTYAMAQYAGFETYMQDIDIPEYWTRRDGFSLLNGHVNVFVAPADVNTLVRFVTTETIVDFDPQESRKHFPIRRIDKEQAMAMFYNNKGAEALIDGSYSKAYAYFRAAAKISEDFDSTYVNLGILYRRSGHNELAANAYERAIEIDSQNYTAWENLAFLHASQGDKELSDTILARVDRERKDNPFYHFILGEQAFDDGKLEQALDFYRAAYRLDNRAHEVLFGLSKTYYELGDISRSLKFMDLAEKNSKNPDQADRYRGKLAILQSAI
jgi:tetratricopeptide (TPR) repeat protein